MRSDPLDRAFAALADPTRRAILARLASGEASVTKLAEPFDMTLPAVSKHLKVLEAAGLIARSRESQWRLCRLEAEPLRNLSLWLEPYRSASESFDRFHDYLERLQGRDGRAAIQALAPILQLKGRWIGTGVIDAPRSLVFDVVTRPEHLRNVLGPPGHTVPVCEMDVRPGGAYHFVTRDPNGIEYPFSGVYREVVPPERLVYTQVYDVEPWSDRSVVITTILGELEGKTLLRNNIVSEATEHLEAIPNARGRGRASKRSSEETRAVRSKGQARSQRLDRSDADGRKSRIAPNTHSRRHHRPT